MGKLEKRRFKSPPPSSVSHLDSSLDVSIASSSHEDGSLTSSKGHLAKEQHSVEFM